MLAYDGMAPFELGVVAEVFAQPRPELQVDWWYSFALCSEKRRPIQALGGFSIKTAYGLEHLSRADTVILLGAADVHGDPSDAALHAVRRAYRRGARIVSICSGAFVLAAAGLLDGRRATTHWRYARTLAERYPRVDVDARSLYTVDGRILTSAGTAAGIDLCLHIVRLDHGAGIANRVARRMVVAPHRDGGQSQFIEEPVPVASRDDPVRRVMDSALSNLGRSSSVEQMARNAHLSARQFTRRFRAATGQTPAGWLIRQRVHASLPLLETSLAPVESVAEAVGFASPAAYRLQFARIVGLSPSAYRDRFRSGALAQPSLAVRGRGNQVRRPATLPSDRSPEHRGHEVDRVEDPGGPGQSRWLSRQAQEIKPGRKDNFESRSSGSGESASPRR